jgi:hypothetical protein
MRNRSNSGFSFKQSSNCLNDLNTRPCSTRQTRRQQLPQRRQTPETCSRSPLRKRSSLCPSRSSAEKNSFMASKMVHANFLAGKASLETATAAAPF